jgi:protein-S-isoprenylcysteine O-methyltransferase Ste14
MKLFWVHPKPKFGDIVPPRTPLIMPLPLALVLGMSAWLVSQLHVLPRFLTFKPLAVIIAGFGILIMAIAFIQFRTHKTSAHPRRFSNNINLLSTGIFAYSRNPIYLGMLLTLFAGSIACGDGLALVPPIIFFVWINFWQISVEEFHLQRLFGEDYSTYCKQVRRWL